MGISLGSEGQDQEIIDLFTATFSDSEGADEGTLIGELARNLLSDTAMKDLFVFTASESERVIGAIIFSRLIYDQDDRDVFVLGPVAVTTDLHGKGIGQILLNYGLATLRERSIDVAVTYGDPNYYSKVGFAPMTENFAKAPFKLQHPEGWLGQSLTAAKLTSLKGTPTCVPALNDPNFW